MSKKKRKDLSQVVTDDIFTQILDDEGPSLSLGMVPENTGTADFNSGTAANLWDQLNSEIAGEKPKASKKAPLGKDRDDKTKALIPPPFVEKDEKTEFMFSPPVELPAIPSDSTRSMNVSHATSLSQVTKAASGTNATNENTIAVTAYNKKPREESNVVRMPSSPASFSQQVAKGSPQKGNQRVVKTEIAVKVNSVEASLVQSENLRLAQDKIHQLEKEIERVRSENEELAASADIFKNRIDDLESQLIQSEKLRKESEESLVNELQFVKSNLDHKEREFIRLKAKNQELESRIHNDFRKIRVRERELENRLELLKTEKGAIVKTKDETILELKRQIDRLEAELDNYKRKTIELGDAVDGNQDQMRRTVRALRIALNHLESSEDSSPLKKAE